MPEELELRLTANEGCSAASTGGVQNGIGHRSDITHAVEHRQDTPLWRTITLVRSIRDLVAGAVIGVTGIIFVRPSGPR